MLTLTDALDALSDLCQPESDEADEGAQFLNRSRLAALFSLLHEYADAAPRTRTNPSI